MTNNQVRIKGFPRYVVLFMTILGLFLFVNQIFLLNLFGFTPIGNGFYYYALACFLSLVYIVYPLSTKYEHTILWVDWFLFLVCIAVNVYFALNAFNILTRGWEYSAPLLPTVASVILWLLALEAIRRTGGWVLFFVSFVISIFPMLADKMPGFLYGRSFSFFEISSYHAMGVESVIGIPTRIVADLLAGFIIFGVALERTGGGKFFMDFALSIMGNTRGGPAKVAVISSGFMGSLSGSVISNVVTTGSVTIPTMKKIGYRSEYAAAVEACASTGGALMPPVMGAAGFLIASFLNVPYSQVMIAAFFPAFLYYLTLTFQVDTYAAKNHLRGMPKEEIPNIWVTLRQGWFYLGAIALLVVILLYFRVEKKAPYYTMLFLFICAFLSDKRRLKWGFISNFLVDAGRMVSQITGILAGIGLIIGALSGTGVANAFSRELLILVRGNIFLLLPAGALISFILGIGMTVTACYLFLAITLVPALVEGGLHPMACHLFVMYWGMISYITPPVALGAITAASIAQADSIKTGLLAVRLGSIILILPFLFVLNPVLILEGPVGNILSAVSTSIVGCIMLACAYEGYMYFLKVLMPWYTRIILGISGILLIFPGLYTNLAGIGIYIILFAYMRKTINNYVRAS